MAARPVEWVLAVFYGRSAHQATYGRKVRGGGYTKDFIQLSRRAEFLEAVANIFSVSADANPSVPLIYQWPKGQAPGAFVFESADRPHLKWETNLGAPQAWKMAVETDDSKAETIPGDPTHTNFEDAEKEFSLIAERGGGQPYLLAIKLYDEPRTLHLRAYLEGPSDNFAWADLALVPQEVRDVVGKTSRRQATFWSLFQSGGVVATREALLLLHEMEETGNIEPMLDQMSVDVGHALLSYLKQPSYGLFFDPTKNHDAWFKAPKVPPKVASSITQLLRALEARFPPALQGDVAAESLPVDAAEVQQFREQMAAKNYAVGDSTSTVKTRGSAQRAFSEAVKKNYGERCAITGVATRDFLVASHIVPWSADQEIRLDPSNGICLSLVVDRAFEKGYLEIDDDLTVRVILGRLGEDEVLKAILAEYDGKKLRPPEREHPSPIYLQRRRTIVNKVD